MLWMLVVFWVFAGVWRNMLDDTVVCYVIFILDVGLVCGLVFLVFGLECLIAFLVNAWRPLVQSDLIKRYYFNDGAPVPQAAFYEFARRVQEIQC